MSTPPPGKAGDAMLLAMWTDWHDGTVSMATNDELSLEWSMLNEDCYTWDDNDLQLAAELGKTLLERNKELETGLKQQQTVIDDQSQEIEYLSKQSVALREVNDSRLRVYEQLEVSIQELEVTNQRLQDETVRDKKRIRSLTQSVECLELRAAELQALVDELRTVEQTLRTAAAAAAAAASQQQTEDGLRDSETKVPSTSDQLAERVTLLERQLTEAKERERQERERRQWAETEVSTAQEECSELRHEMAALRERSVKLHTLAEEVHALEEHRLSPYLRTCSPRACSASPQVAGESHAASAEPPHSVWGEDTVHWSGADHVNGPASVAAAVAIDDPGSGPASLISDLDAHYRVLLDHMDKYEWRLTSRPPRPATPDQPSSLSLLEELQLSAAPPPPTSLRAAPLRDSGPASLMMLGAASDGDASSSGFSEGSDGSRAVSRATQTSEMTQTPPPPSQPQTMTTMTSTMMSSKEMTAAAAVTAMATSTPQRKVTTTRFQHTPQYKQLFQEIFQVLKKPVVVSSVLSSPSSASPVGFPAAASTPSSASCTGVTSLAEISSSDATVEAEEVEDAVQTTTATETISALYATPLSQEKNASAATEPASEDVSLRSTLPAGVLVETIRPVSQSPERSECCPRATSSRSRSTSASRTFSYAEEYERRLRESTPAGVDGVSEAPPCVTSSGTGEEFPLLVRPSEEVAKLRLLERSYAEALKAGRRCFYRPTML